MWEVLRYWKVFRVSNVNCATKRYKEEGIWKNQQMWANQFWCSLCSHTDPTVASIQGHGFCSSLTFNSKFLVSCISADVIKIVCQMRLKERKVYFSSWFMEFGWLPRYQKLGAVDQIASETREESNECMIWLNFISTFYSPGFWLDPLILMVMVLPKSMN